jgi:hypothetical protein
MMRTGFQLFMGQLFMRQLFMGQLFEGQLFEGRFALAPHTFSAAVSGLAQEQSDDPTVVITAITEVATERNVDHAIQ